MLYSGMSDIGRKRSSNQDTFRITEFESPNGIVLLAVVCDGMGGMNGGNVASELAVETFTASFGEALSKHNSGESESPSDDGTTRTFRQRADKTSTALSPIALALRSAASAANRVVVKRAADEPSLEGMGTTLLAACFVGDTMYVANVGDSRLYLVTGDTISRVTKDHSYVQYLIDAGELSPDEAEKSPYRNIITRAVGREDYLDTDIFTLPMSAFCGYVLMCSDGLYNFISEEEMTMVIGSCVKGGGECELDSKVSTLVRRANENGGGDNITAVLIKCKV